MSFWLTDKEMDEEIEANRTALERFDDFDRDEDGWDEIWEGLYAILADAKSEVREVFGLDPRKSTLFSEFPGLLWSACDPQQPIVYGPSFREFGWPVFDGGPAFTTLRFDPYTGKQLPGSVRDAYFDEAEKLLGKDVALFDEELGTLPDAFRSEQWWIERGI